MTNWLKEEERRFAPLPERLEASRLEMAWVWLAVLLAFAAYAAAALAWIIPRSTDMIVRYAPMADHFARGEWRHAFHPRFCWLFPILAGTVRFVTGLAGDRACQLTAIAAWCVAAVPLWSIVRGIAGRFAAVAAVAICLTNVDLFVLATDGWRDPCRALPTLLFVLGFMRTASSDGRTALMGGVWVALGMFLTLTLRVDAFVVSSAVLLVFLVFCLTRRRILPAAVAVLGWIAGAVAESLLVFWFTGWFLPAPQMVKILEGMP